MGSGTSHNRAESRVSRSAKSSSIRNGTEADKKTKDTDQNILGSNAALYSTTSTKVHRAEPENIGLKATLVKQTAAKTAPRQNEATSFDLKSSLKVKKKVKFQQKVKRPPSKQGTSMFEDFSMDSYKSMSQLSSREIRRSVLDFYPDRKQTSEEYIEKPKYVVTEEDILDSDKSNEPMLNSARRDQAKQVFCITHNGSNVIMHCRKCDRLVCDECITTVHKRHDLFEISKQGKQDKITLKEKLSDVRARSLPLLKKNLTYLVNTKKTSMAEFDRMIEQIKQRSVALVNSVERARDRLINRCSSDEMASHAFLAKLEDKLSTGVIAIEAALISTEDALTLDRDPATVHERIKMQWLLDKYRRTHLNFVYPKFIIESSAREDAVLEKMIGYFEGMLRCEAKDQLYRIMIDVMPIGPLKPVYLKTIPYYHKVRTACPAGDDKICVVPVLSETAFDIMTSEGVSVLIEVENAQIYDITRTMDNHFLVSDAKNKKVLRISQAGVIVKWTYINGIPRGIYACRNGDILVCVLDSIEFNNSPREHKKGHVVRINEKFMTYKTYGKKEELFTIPYRVFENINGDICVIDRISGIDSRLIVLDYHGDVRFHFPEKVSFDDSLANFTQPRQQAFSDVCCDDYANIYLVDERNGEVVVLDQDGVKQKYVEEIFARKRDKAEMDIVSPQRVVLDPNGKIWIIQNRKITMFSLYG